MKINWKQKLTSRKLWAALIAIIVTVIVALFKDEIPPEVVNLIGKGVIALCVYIFGEASVDIARAVWNKATALGETIAEIEAPAENTVDTPLTTAGGTAQTGYVDTDTIYNHDTEGNREDENAEAEQDEAEDTEADENAEKPPDADGSNE